MSLPEISIVRAAKQMIDQHGAEAEAECERRAARLAAQGDAAG